MQDRFILIATFRAAFNAEEAPAVLSLTFPTWEAATTARQVIGMRFGAYVTTLVLDRETGKEA